MTFSGAGAGVGVGVVGVGVVGVGVGVGVGAAQAAKKGSDAITNIRQILPTTVINFLLVT